MSEMRMAGYPSPDDVSYAFLEETGHISVIPKPDKRPLQPVDLSLTPPDEGLPVALVADGEIRKNKLEYS